MSNNFFTPEEISELVTETSDKILELAGVRNLESKPLQVIYRPLKDGTKRNHYQKPFFLISLNGCSCRLIINTEKGAKVKTGPVNTNIITLDENVMSLNESLTLLNILKDYLITCVKRIVEDYIPEEPERVAEFLGLGTRECFEWLAGCMDNHKYRNVHRIRYVDMTHG